MHPMRLRIPRPAAPPLRETCLDSPLPVLPGTGTKFIAYWTLGQMLFHFGCVKYLPIDSGAVLGVRVKFFIGSLLVIVAAIGLGSCAGVVGHGKTPAAIVVQPVSQSVRAPASATFSVVATGTPTPTYQWQQEAPGQNSFSNISGATSASYTTPATTTSQSGTQIRVVVTNTAGSVTSSVVTLTVNAGNVAPTITSQPVNATVTAPATATFSVTASGTPTPTYQWQQEAPGQNSFSNISGATSASYTTPATTTSQSGTQFQVVVTNTAGSITSSVVALTVNPANAAPSGVTVLTYHNDSSRSGVYSNETTLTPNNVNSVQFGQLGTLSVDGLVEAQPLYVGGLTVNGSTHNVLFVATENDSVYAFDADSETQLWQVSMLPSGESIVTSSDVNCTDLQPDIGITSTPVIDLSAGPNGTIFLVAKSKLVSGSTTTFHLRLHALDITTGADLMTANDIQATYPGNGTNSSNGVQTFVPQMYNERAALLLLNGVIYTSFGSHCDNADYTSWVMSFNESNLQSIGILNLTANGTSQGGREGGIWMAGAGPAADPSGNIYLITGNGTFDTTLDNNGFPSSQDYGNTFVKLSTNSGNMSVADYFTMYDTLTESTNDQDFGSGGAIVLPDLLDSQNNVHHLAVGGGKDGNIYVVDRDNMGKFNSSNDNAIYQELDGVLGGGIFDAPVFFNNTLFYGPNGGNVVALPVSNALVSTSGIMRSSGTFNFPGTQMAVSANGTSNGILWVSSQTGGSGTLIAFNAANMNQLFSSSYNDTNRAKFATPMVANGKVFIGSGPTSGSTGGSVAIFGLLNP